MPQYGRERHSKRHHRLIQGPRVSQRLANHDVLVHLPRTMPPLRYKELKGVTAVGSGRKPKQGIHLRGNMCYLVVLTFSHYLRRHHLAILAPHRPLPPHDKGVDSVADGNDTPPLGNCAAIANPGPPPWDPNPSNQSGRTSLAPLGIGACHHRN
jgi:hypothetical protein